MTNASDGRMFDAGDRDVAEGLARVVAVEGDLVWLEPEPPSACCGCASAGVCGGGSKNPRRLAAQRFSLVNDHHLGVGERIVVGVTDRSLVGAAATAYALPLLVMFAAALVAQSQGGGDGAAAGAAIGGLVVGLVIARVWAKRLEARGALKPRFLRRARGPAVGETCNLAESCKLD